MTDQHPITPPQELILEWWNRSHLRYSSMEIEQFTLLVSEISQWGADQELEACLSQLHRWGVQGVQNLRNTRRPYSLSLKHQALQALKDMNISLEDGHNVAIIRQVLEQLPD